MLLFVGSFLASRLPLNVTEIESLRGREVHILRLDELGALVRLVEDVNGGIEEAHAVCAVELGQLDIRLRYAFDMDIQQEVVDGKVARRQCHVA